MNATVDTLRRIPAEPRSQDHCTDCRRPIIWAVMQASATSRGGAHIALDPFEHPEGNRAVRQAPGGRLIARALGNDESLDGPWEYLAIVHHFATCPKRPTDPNPRLPDDVPDLAAHRARKQGAR